MFEKWSITVLARFLVVVLFLSAAMILGARGRTRGYQAGGGAHRAQPKLRVKQPKDKQKKPTPPPEIKTDPVTTATR
jgi:hypothetical protein